MFCIVCRKYPTVADKASRLYVGINGSSCTGFRHDSLVSLRTATLITFAFCELKRRKTRADAAAANKL